MSAPLEENNRDLAIRILIDHGFNFTSPILHINISLLAVLSTTQLVEAIICCLVCLLGAVFWLGYFFLRETMHYKLVL